MKKNLSAKKNAAYGPRLQKLALLTAISFIFFCNHLNAQTCCLTASLNVNRGNDRNLTGTIAPYYSDPRWQITTLSMDTGIGVDRTHFLPLASISWSSSCPSTQCQLVENGDFNTGNLNCGSMDAYVNYNAGGVPTDIAAIICNWQEFINTPDLYAPGCSQSVIAPDPPVEPGWTMTSPFAAAQNGGYEVADPTEPVTGSFIGLWGGYYNDPGCSGWDGEGIQTQLSAPLVKGERYVLDFYARVAVDPDSLGFWSYHDIYLQFYTRSALSPFPQIPGSLTVSLCADYGSAEYSTGALPTSLLDVTQVNGFKVTAQPLPGNAWNHITDTFTYCAMNDTLSSRTNPQYLGIVTASYITAAMDGVFIPDTTTFDDYVFVDNVSIIPLISRNPDTMSICGDDSMKIYPDYLVMDTSCHSNQTAIVDTYLWTPTTYLSCSYCDSPYFIPPVVSDTATESLILHDTLYGCIDTINIKVYPPLPGITGSTTVCAGATTTLYDSTGGGTWSSGNALIATVDSTTGVVTGMGTGAATIAYTTFCGTVAVRVTVKLSPLPITGPDSVCVGSTISLIDPTSGGVWTIGPAAIATITAGIVTGDSAGEAVVMYLLPMTNCFVTDTIMVNPLPPPITAASAHVCVGDTLTVIDFGEIGGTWSSSNTSIATVVDTSLSLTTVITGVSAGVVTITFTLPTGCFATVTFTVIAALAPIAGPDSVCVGDSITLSDGTPGGTWSISSTIIATDSGGIVTGISTGTAVVTYTVHRTGCYVTDIIHVDSLPVISPITGYDTLCAGATTTLADSAGGGEWSSLNTLIATVSVASGYVTGAGSGAVTIKYSVTNNCGSAAVTQSVYVRPLPVVAPITGSEGVCTGTADTLYDDSTGGVWTSAITAIATVDPDSGFVTGVSTGLVNVSYTVTNSCGSTSVYRTLSVNMPPYITTNFVVACQTLGGASRDFTVVGPPTIVSSAGCMYVCDSSTVRYYGNGVAGSSFSWDVTGGTVAHSYGDSIDVFWGTAGITATIILYDTVSHCIGEDSICIQVIQKPRASFTQSADTVCLNSTIYFTSTSTADSASPILSTYWFFSDGGFTDGASAAYEFRRVGIDTVTMVVINGCGCSDTMRVVDTVFNTPGPVIICPSIACDSQYMTYSTAADTCSLYNWSVTGGTITSGLGTPIITVDWNSVGANDEGYVSLLEPCAACPDVSTIKIPILPETAVISGPASFCAGSQNVYSLPLWPATTYSWGVIGCPTCIVTSRGDNTVGIEFPYPGVFIVHGWYQNKVKLCGGNVTTTVNVLPVSTITGSLLACQNTPASYMLADGLPENWTLTGPTVAEDTSMTGPVFTYSFPATGFYRLSAGGSACANSISINVSAPPTALSGITGPDTVCLNRVYSYSTGPGDLSSNPQWSITGGTLYPASGYTVNVIWTSAGTKMLSAWRRKNTPPYCTGLADTISVIQAPVVIPIYGSTTPCANTAQTYYTPYTEGEAYNWTIAPNTAGSVLTSLDTPFINVAWNNVTGPALPAQIVLAVTKCDSTYYDTFAVSVQPQPGIVITPTLDSACPGQWVGFKATAGDSSYAWNFGGTALFELDTFYWPMPPNNTTGNESFEVRVTGLPFAISAGCAPAGSAAIDVTVLPAPAAVATTSNVLSWICPVNDADSAFIVGLVTNNLSGLAFQWYKDNVAISGATDTSLMVYDTGSYSFAVTAGDGCSSASYPVFIDTCTGPSGGGPDLNPVAVTGNCNIITLYGLIPAYSYDWLWQATSAPVSAIDMNTATARVAYGVAGIYVFTYSFEDTIPPYGYSIGLSYGFVADTLGVVPAFDYTVRCTGAGNDSITLRDITSYLQWWSITGIQWFRGASFLGSDSTLSIAEPAPGTYYITEVVSYTGPDGTGACSVTDTIVTPPIPVAAFTFAPSPICEGVPIQFTNTSVGGIIQYNWDFGDSSSSILENPERNYTWRGPIADPQPFFVTLTVTDTLGCSESVTQTVYVYDNLLAGGLGPTFQFVCSNNVPVILTWENPPSGIPFDPPDSFVWSNGVRNTTGMDTITTTGDYWVTVYDTVKQCQKTLPAPDVTQVTIIPMPTAQFTGLQNYCIGDSIQLYSDAGHGVALLWYRNDTAVDTGTSITDTGLAPGAYNYFLIASVTDSFTCADTSAIDTTHMYALPPAPVITGPVPADCSTYLELMTASEPMDGTYNWSNGANTAIDSVHSGGPYRVWFTDLQGCINYADTTVPPSAASLFAYFPVGCYTLCNQLLPLTLYGPPGDTLSYWAWIDNGDTLSSGTNGVMPSYPIDSSGSYTWYLSNGGCGQLSDTMNVTVDSCQCPTLAPITATLICSATDSPASYTVTLTSISPGDSIPYTVGTNLGPIDPFSGILDTGHYTLTPLTFTSFTFTVPYPVSVTIEIIYTMPSGANCLQQTTLPLPLCPDWDAERQSGDTSKNNSQAAISSAMLVFPNPTSGDVTISYNYGSNQYNEQNITVYDEMGTKIATTVPQNVQGNWVLNTNDWTPGIYIIRMEADGKALQTQRMVVVSK